MKLNFKNFKSYSNDGVIKVNKVFSHKEISLLKKKIDTYIKKNLLKLKGKEINYINNQVNSVHRFSDRFFKDFANQKKILNLGNFFLSEKPKIRHYEYFAKPKKIGLASPMHQDNFYWNLKNPNCFTMWIAIDKAKKNNGSVEYLVGSHKKMYAHVPSYAPGSSQKVKKLSYLKKKFKKKIFDLDSGDCLIHNSQIVHGSKRNLSKLSRRGFTVQVTPKNVKIDLKKFKKYQDSFTKQIKMRKN